MVVMLKINKKILIVFLLLSIFAVGTLSFVGAVEAAKWTKYDSGKYSDEYPLAGYKKVVSYQSYTKGNNALYVDSYVYPKKGGKQLSDRTTFTKKNNVLKITSKNYFSNEIGSVYYETTGSVKSLYKAGMKNIIEDSGISLEKKAFNKQTFTVKNNTFKIYGIKDGKDMSAYIYKNGERYSSFGVSYVYHMEYNKKYRTITNKNVYYEYNQKGKLTAIEAFKTTQSISSIYKNKLNKLINKLKSS